MECRHETFRIKWRDDTSVKNHEAITTGKCSCGEEIYERIPLLESWSAMYLAKDNSPIPIT